MIGSAAAPGLSFAIVSFALTGAGNALLCTPEMRLQDLSGVRLLSRVFGLRDAVCNLAYVLAFVTPARCSRCSASGVSSPSAASACSATAAGCLGVRQERTGDALPVLVEVA